jgi:hypothetical protein
LSKGVRFLSARASAAATADTGPRGEWRAHCALSTRIWTSKPSLASSRAPQPTSRSLGSEGGISAFSSDLSSLPTVHSAHCYVLWHTHSARQRGVRPATRRCDCCQSPSQAVRANCTPRCITSRHAAALPHLTFQNAKRKTKIQFSCRDELVLACLSRNWPRALAAPRPWPTDPALLYRSKPRLCELALRCLSARPPGCCDERGESKRHFSILPPRSNRLDLR